MLKAKHTPGPWRATPGLVIHANGVTVGRCAGSHCGDGVDAANAALIAAAPELLEALRIARVYVEDAYFCDFPDDAENAAVLAAIDATIAKAEGGAA